MNTDDAIAAFIAAKGITRCPPADAKAMRDLERGVRVERVEDTDDEAMYRAERQAEMAAEFFHGTGRRCTGFDADGFPV